MNLGEFLASEMEREFPRTNGQIHVGSPEMTRYIESLLSQEEKDMIGMTFMVHAALGSPICGVHFFLGLFMAHIFHKYREMNKQVSDLDALFAKAEKGETDDSARTTEKS